MHFRDTAAVLLLSSGCVVGCRGDPAMVVLTADSAGKAVLARVGEQLEVRLPETPTTGYQWRVNEGCTTLLDKQTDARHTDAARPGAPGEHRWVFVARVPGSCELRFTSGRAWEASATGKQIAFPITIQAAQP